MNFIAMIAGLKQGKAYRRPEWPAGDLIMFKPKEPGGAPSKIIGSLIKLTAQGDVIAFSATAEERNAIDWVEVD